MVDTPSWMSEKLLQRQERRSMPLIRREKYALHLHTAVPNIDGRALKRSFGMHILVPRSQRPRFELFRFQLRARSETKYWYVLGPLRSWRLSPSSFTPEDSFCIRGVDSQVRVAGQLFRAQLLATLMRGSRGVVSSLHISSQRVICAS